MLFYPHFFLVAIVRLLFYGIAQKAMRKMFIKKHPLHFGFFSKQVTKRNFYAVLHYFVFLKECFTL